MMTQKSNEEIYKSLSEEERNVTVANLQRRNNRNF